jgi:hypothetical protein
MTKQPQKLDFSQNARCVRDMLEDVIDLLDGHFLASVRINGTANHTIAPFPNHLLDLVAIPFPILGEKLTVYHVLHTQKETKPKFQFVKLLQHEHQGNPESKT